MGSENNVSTALTLMAGTVLDAVVAIDSAGMIVEWNAAAERVFGWSRSEVLGQSMAALIVPDEHRHGHQMGMARYQRTGEAQVLNRRIEITAVAKGGRVFPIELSIVPLSSPEDEIFVGFIRDISERKIADERLLLSEESLRLTTSAAEVGTWDLDLETAVLTWSPLTRRMFGIHSDMPYSMADFYAGLHPDDHDAISKAFLGALDPAVRATYDVQYRTIGKEDGVVRWVAAKGKGLFDEAGRCVRAVGTAVDITGRKSIEEELRENRSFLNDVLSSSGEAFYAVDRAGTTTLCNQAFLRLLGFEREEDAIGRKLHDIIHHSHPDGSCYDKSDCPIYICASTGEAAHIDNENFYRLNGEAIPVDYWVTPIFRDGVHHGAICTFTDITERRAAEAKLQATARSLADLNATLEERVAQQSAERDRLWKTSQDLLVVVGSDGIFRAANPAWTSVLGWSIDEVVGQHHLSFVHRDDHGASAGALNQAFQAPLPNFENRCLHKDGTYRWIAWIASADNGLVYAAGRNVTAEKEAEAQLFVAREALRQSQKMEAVGQLTGGIAHDFNNMLAVISGSLELLERRLPDGDGKAQRYLNAAVEAARRSALLTQRLLAFSRQQPLQPEAIDANKLVAGMSELLRHSIGADIRLETVLAGGMWRTLADPNQLENILVNLAVNARDAMPDGGRLTIETQNAHLDERYAAATVGLSAGQYVLIAVTDTGSGMSPEVVETAFDPFFTTKPIGKGTGLGLSQVYGFVKQTGGHVNLYSEVGAGTTVKIYLPRLDRAVEAPYAEGGDVEIVTGNEGEFILVVEDEESVRQYSVDALTELGYQVLEADGSAAALQLLEAHPQIALVFTDIVMPDVNGAKLAEEIRSRWPHMKILFTTGYTRNAVVHNGVLDPGVDLISKPFTLEALSSKVRAVLEASAFARRSA